MYTSLSERTPPPHTSAARPRRPRLVDSSRLVLHHLIFMLKLASNSLRALAVMLLCPRSHDPHMMP